MIAWLLSAVLTAGVYEDLIRDGAETYPNAPTITVADAQLRRDALFVDVRSAAEISVSIIDNAIAADALPADIGDRTVIVYCTIGVRSGEFTQALRARGIDAYNLYGGVLAWARASGVFRDPSGAPTRRVHVYGKRWNYLPDGYEPVWD